MIDETISAIGMLTGVSSWLASSANVPAGPKKATGGTTPDRSGVLLPTLDFALRCGGCLGRRAWARGAADAHPPGRAVQRRALGAAGALVVALVLLRRPEGSAEELELARRVMAWRSSTDFLLPDPGAGLLTSTPRFGVAPAGSPLQSLDPGGPLGPPVPPRSPRS